MFELLKLKGSLEKCRGCITADGLCVSFQGMEEFLDALRKVSSAGVVEVNVSLEELDIRDF